MRSKKGIYGSISCWDFHFGMVLLFALLVSYFTLAQLLLHFIAVPISVKGGFQKKKNSKS